MEKKEFRTALSQNSRTMRFVSKSAGIGQEILDALKRKNMTQRELAEKLGCSETLVSRWLGGLQNFTLRTLTQIEEVLEQDLILTPTKAAAKYKQNAETVVRQVLISQRVYEQLKDRIAPDLPMRETSLYTREMYGGSGVAHVVMKHHFHENVVAKKNLWQLAE